MTGYLSLTTTCTCSSYFTALCCASLLVTFAKSISMFQFQNMTPTFSDWTTIAAVLPMGWNSNFFPSVDNLFSLSNSYSPKEVHFYGGERSFHNWCSFDLANESFSTLFNLTNEPQEYFFGWGQSFTFVNNITYASRDYSLSNGLFMISLNGNVSSVRPKGVTSRECCVL